MKNKLLKSVLCLNILILTIIISSCSQTACDCANLYVNNPMTKEHTPQQLDDADFLRREADKYVEKAKNCAIQYGNLTEMEKEIAKSTLEMNMIPKLDEAIENAKIECASNKEFNKNELEIACDCWNQSVEKSGISFDDMNSSQQQFRQKCFTIFGDEASMKVACGKVMPNMFDSNDSNNASKVSIKTTSESNENKSNITEEEFLEENKKKEGVITTASGLQYKVIKMGTGATPTLNDRITAHYVGTLMDGTVFESSVERGQPATFPVNGVIPGWTEALQIMPVGSKWTLYIPSKLAYGERGAGGKIGPNTAIIFDVQLISIDK